MIYEINEIFYSIQGEGRNTGMPAIFIRFSGCNLSCSYCDTNYSPKLKMTTEDIIESIKKFPCQNIVLTGGEPTLQPISELIEALQDNSYYICVETNGYNFMETLTADWVTFSPKHGGKIPEVIKWDELKVVYTGQNLHQYEKVMAEYNYLQPCDLNGKMNIEETIKRVKEDSRWLLSLQIQKLLNIA